MKRLAAIFLISIHLFNMGGYQVLYQYFMYQSDRVMNEHIENNQYNVNDLVEVKIPVNVPYLTDWKDYESVTGQIQFQDGCYNYVKLKLTKDTMYVKCIPNYEKTRLVNSNVISAKQVTDTPSSKHADLPSIKKNSSELYNFVTFNFYLNSTFTFLQHFTAHKAINVKQGVVQSPFLPPEHDC